MRIDDQLQLGMANLWRTRLRTFLTTLGVIIGIGALVSMVSFGMGMQKNITAIFHENDLFTSLYVTPQKIDVDAAMSGDVAGAVKTLKEEAPALGDSALESFRELPGVELAFPETRFPVKLQLDDHNTRTTLRALPSIMGRYKPFSTIPHGSFFESDSDASVILMPRILKSLKILIDDPENPVSLSPEDSSKGFRVLPPDSILGKEIIIITSVVDFNAVMKNPLRHLNRPTDTPIRDVSTTFKITGILNKPEGFEGGRFDSGIYIPMKTVGKIPRLGFSSVWQLLRDGVNSEGYSSVYVRVKKLTDLDPVKEAIEKGGYGVFSIADQLKELKRGFLIFDAALGAVGAIALIVAALGIINTMVTSILERTREIGIMKAIGGSENEIKSIFFIEAGTIGLIGGLLGLLLGWGVTRIANAVANYYIMKEGGYHVEFFFIPFWLILGAIIFAILVSLAAGLYPAIRAARVDPVKALRHD